MKTTTSKTDLVEKMRDIRDKFSLEIMDMTIEQEREYVKNQLTELKLKTHARQQPALKIITRTGAKVLKIQMPAKEK